MVELRGLAAGCGAMFLLCACGGPQSQTTGAADPMPPEEKPVAETEESEPEPEPPKPAPPRLEAVTVTVVAAEVASRMKDGRPWDGTEPRLPRGVQEKLLRYLEVHPELQFAASHLGVPVDSPKLARTAQKDEAPDPMVFVEIGDHLFRTPVRPRAFAPLWDFQLVFSYGFGKRHMGVVPGSMVRIHVVDYDSPTSFDIMGTKLISLEELLDKPVHKLTRFGSVDSLTLQISRTPIDDLARPASSRLAVPAKPSWTETGIDVVAGQRLLLEAADEVCTTREGLDKCAGPEGQRVTDDNNLPGFEKLGHGALVGAIGDTRFVVGRRLELIAPSSGTLRLGVNDGHYQNNRGSFAARVTVRSMPVPSYPRPANTDAAAADQGTAAGGESSAP